MGSIQSLCEYGILLDRGRLVTNGRVGAIIDQYLTRLQEDGRGKKLYDLPRRPGLGVQVKINDCAVCDTSGSVISQLRFGEPFSVRVGCVGIESLQNLQFVVGINSRTQDRITTLFSPERFDLGKGQYVKGEVYLPSLYLLPGHYTLTVGIRQLKAGMDHLEYIASFEVLEVRNEAQIGRELITFGLIQIMDAEWHLAASGVSP